MLKRIAFQAAMVAALLSPAAIAQAGYPDTNRPVAQDNGNGSGGIPSQLYAFTCTTTCFGNSCTTNCF